MKIRKAYLFCFLFSFLGVFESSLSVACTDAFHKLSTSDHKILANELVFEKSSDTPFNTPPKPGENGENQKEKEKELEDDNDKDEDEKDEAFHLVCLHTLLASNKSKPAAKASASSSYFFLNKQVPLFVLFHSWKSHLF